MTDYQVEPGARNSLLLLSFFWVEDELALDVEAVTLASLMLFSWLTSRSTGSIGVLESLELSMQPRPWHFSATLFCALRVFPRGSLPSESHYACQHPWASYKLLLLQ